MPNTELDEELMKEFDKLQTDAIEKLRVSEDAVYKFSVFVKSLKNRKFKIADTDHVCKIDVVSPPNYKFVSDGFVSHERLNFDRHWYNKSAINDFGKFCNAVKHRKFLILKKENNDDINI